MTSETPELDKQKAIIDSGRNAVVQEFLEWLDSKQIVLGRYATVDGYHDEQFIPLFKSNEAVMFEFFDINPVKIEQERRQILAHLRAQVTEVGSGSARTDHDNRNS